MQTIRCRYCNEEILVLPDAKAMDRAIDRHAETKHKLADRENVADELTIQVLDALTIDPAFPKGNIRA